MEFNPAIHTKEFLLNNPKVAFELADKSVEFSACALASDLELISLVVNAWGDTVAHRLAQHQSEWLRSDASKSVDILELANKNGYTVAHQIANYQSEWLRSDASKSVDILKLADKHGYTVAHTLAEYQPEWFQTDASKLSEILHLANELGYTVAYAMLSDEQCLKHDPLFHKEILTLERDDAILAERITEIYSLSHGMNVPTMAMKLIEQGAAYKLSKPMALKVGDTLLKQCKILIEDNFDVQISLKQLMALYSTFSHNVSKIISTEQQKSLQQWQELLVKSEKLLCQHLSAHPELYDIEHTVDIFCEPADDLLKKIQSERILGEHFCRVQDSISGNDMEPSKQGLY
jgi:hypothetical protein